MIKKINIGGFNISLTKKNIKNIHLSIHPPFGLVKISAPYQMDNEAIKSFAFLKLNWIKKNYKKVISQERETPRELLNGESLYIWGERFLVKNLFVKTKPPIFLDNKKIIINANPLTDFEKKQSLLETWFREEIREYSYKLISVWDKKLHVSPKKLYVQRMLTKWGSCNVNNETIRINTELIHKPKKAIEYVIVHEMIHFLERRHSPAFFKLLDKILPDWRITRQRLNEIPLSYLTSKRLY